MTPEQVAARRELGKCAYEHAMSTTKCNKDSWRRRLHDTRLRAKEVGVLVSEVRRIIVTAREAARIDGK